MTPQDSSFDYELFISYRRADASRLADYLRRRLQTTKIPADVLNVLPPSMRENAKKAPRIYLDIAYERAASDFLEQKIIPALKASERLLVISTPSAFEDIVDASGHRSPNWLCREIDEFFRDRGADAADNIFVVRGPNAPIDRFPGRLNENPRWDWVDLTRFGWKSWFDESNDEAIAKLIAGLHDIPDGLLPRLRQEERRRRVRLATTFAVTGTTVAIGFAGLAAFAHFEQRQAEHQTILSHSRQLAAQAVSETDRNLLVAHLLAASAWKTYPTDEAAGSLQSVLSAHPQLIGFLPTEQTQGVLSVALGLDRKTVASGGADGTIELWDMNARRRIGHPLKEHRSAVESLAFSPDMKVLASSDDGGNVILWDLQRQEPIGGPLATGQGTVWSVAFSRDGSRLATAGNDQTVLLWDLGSRAHLGAPLKSGHGPVYSVVFSPDGKTLATGTNEFAQLWNIEQGQAQNELPTGHQGQVWSVAFSPDGESLATADAGGTVLMWNLTRTPPTNEVIPVQQGSTRRVAFSPDGTLLAAGGDDHTVVLWNVKERRIRAAPLRAEPGPVWALAFSSDAGTLAVGGSTAAVALWAVNQHPPLARPPWRQDERVLAVAYSPDGKMLASANGKGKVLLWDIPGWRPLGELPGGFSSQAQAIAFSRDGRLLSATGGQGETIVWKVADGKALFPPLKSNQVWIGGIAFSPDGKTIAAAGAVQGATTDGSVSMETHAMIVLWDLSGTTPTARALKADGLQSTSATFMPDGKTLATVDLDGRVTLWDLTQDPPRADILPGSKHGALHAVAVSPDGSRMAVGGTDHSIVFWDMATRKECGQPLKTSQDRTIQSIAFSPDGKTIATAEDDGAVIRWDVERRIQLGAPLAGHSAAVSSVAYSPDGTTIASAGDDRMVMMWNVDPDHWWHDACAIANRPLSEDEWAHFLGSGVEHVDACPESQSAKETAAHASSPAPMTTNSARR